MKDVLTRLMKRFLQDVVVTELRGKALKTIEVHKKKKQIKVEEIEVEPMLSIP